MKHTRIRLACLVLGSLIYSSACKTVAPSSELKHVENEIVRPDSGAWQWAELSREDFALKSLGIDIAPDSEDPRRVLIFDQDHPSSQFVSYWIKAIDQRLRQRYPKQLQAVPIPQGLVIASEDPNAFVSGIPLCFRNINVDLEGSGVRLRGRTEGQSPSALSFTQEGRFGFVRFDPESCIDAKEELFQNILATVTGELRRRGLESQCPVSFDAAEKEIRFNDICRDLVNQVSGAATIPHPENFQIHVPANWISFHSGLFLLPYPDNRDIPDFRPSTDDAFHKERLVAVIAHELAHYYRTHQLQFPGDYNFYYWRNDFDRRGKPSKPPLQQLFQIQNEFQTLGRLRSSEIEAVPGARLSPQQFLFLKYVIKNTYSVRLRALGIIEDPEFQRAFQRPHEDCTTAFSYTVESGRNDYPFVIGFPQVHPSSPGPKAADDLDKSERIQSFLQAEQALLQCAAALPIQGLPVSRRGQDSWDSIDGRIRSWTWMIEAYDEPTPADYDRARNRMRQRLGENYARFLDAAHVADYAELPSALRGALNNSQVQTEIPTSFIGKPLSLVLPLIDAAYTSVSAELQGHLRKLRQMNIGWYTTEEEADSLATEILARIGINPRASIASDFGIYLYFQQSDRLNSILNPSLSECHQMLLQNWPLPPLSRLSLEHPSWFLLPRLQSQPGDRSASIQLAGADSTVEA